MRDKQFTLVVPYVVYRSLNDFLMLGNLCGLFSLFVISLFNLIFIQFCYVRGTSVNLRHYLPLLVVETG